jgi:LTXXQ motif family protein
MRAQPRPRIEQRARQQRRQERVRRQQRQENVQQRIQRRERLQRREQTQERLQRRRERAEERLQRRHERALQPDRRDDRQRAQQREQREQRRQERAAERKERLEQREQRRQHRTQRREQLLRERTQQREQRRQERLEARQQRRDRVTREAAARGRFAAQFRADRRQAREARRQAREALRIAPRHAWRRQRRAHFVAWVGPVFWPFAYFDIFHYTFWPYAYDRGYWAYAYDDIFEGIFWPYGSPYSQYAYAAPYPDGMRGALPGGPEARSRATARAVAQVCEPAKGVTAWPFERIEDAVRPDQAQEKLLDDLKTAATKAADTFEAACPTDVPMTPTGRLQVLIERFEATLEAVRIVRPPLEAFYNSLSDEQKARFNLLGPKVGRDRRGDQAQAQGDVSRCGDPKPGLIDLPIERLDEVVRPRKPQQKALDELREATANAVGVLQSACPDVIPQTPVGRLEAMESRIKAMVDAARAVQPALETFYASLDSEQKARFNTLGNEARNRRR